MSGHDWSKDAAEIDAIVDPAMREAVRKANRRAREHAEALERGAKFSPDNRVSKVEPRVQHVRDLVASHPELARKPAKLRKLADEKILDGMSPGTFGNRVGDARKFHGIG